MAYLHFVSKNNTIVKLVIGVFSCILQSIICLSWFVIVKVINQLFPKGWKHYTVRIIPIRIAFLRSNIVRCLHQAISASYLGKSTCELYGLAILNTCRGYFVCLWLTCRISTIYFNNLLLWLWRNPNQTRQIK